MNAVLLPLLLALGAAPLTALAGIVRPRSAAPLATLLALAAFVGIGWGWSRGGGTVSIPWAPTWGLTLTFTLDGLAVLYALLATGIAVAVLLYACGYIPLHLQHQERPETDGPRFYALILLFMGAMVGLVVSQDMLLIFLFWDVTAIASYYLIGYDNAKAEARGAALMALLVTGISAILIMIGFLMLAARYGTYGLPEVIARATPGTAHSVALVLIAAGALVKSAQVPFHFWLPRAMAAPTPVSAYLHSAAMVAAGVFLLGRVYPLLLLSTPLLNALLVVGFLSMIVGSTLALTRDHLKPLLAYSTVAQYGYVVVMLGLGTGAGVSGATFYVLAHALAKSALFLTAGAVIEATEEDELARLGGLARRLPTLAIASGIAAAGLGALPLTLGFFKDELFFAAALDRGPVFGALAVLGAALTFSYIWHFWSSIFLGPVRAEAHRLSPLFVAPIVALAVLILAGGVVVTPPADFAGAAARVSFPEIAMSHPAYHLDARAENLMALGTYALGALIVGTRRWWIGLALVWSRLGEMIGPERLYRDGLAALNRFSRVILAVEVRDLRGRIATVLIPAALLVAAGFAATPTIGAYRLGAITARDLPLIAGLALVILAAITVAIPRSHLSLLLALSSVGYTLSAIFAFFGAPNVALIMALVETIMTLLVLGILSLFPRDVLHREQTRPESRSLRRRDLLIGSVAALFAFASAWGTLSQPAISGGVAYEMIRLTPDAHAKNAVTAILADFRGLDTLGEITVIWIAFIGLLTLLGRRETRE
jgi:multicomponent Na+:H+ antiporter subunit A